MKARLLMTLLLGVLIVAGCETTENEALRGQLDKSGALKNTEEPKTPAGIYDKALLQKISQKWYALVGDKYRTQEGSVTMEFDLLADGTVCNLKAAHEDLELQPVEFCKQAILESAPFAPFPKELAGTWGSQRHIKFTFQYSL